MRATEQQVPLHQPNIQLVMASVMAKCKTSLLKKQSKTQHEKSHTQTNQSMQEVSSSSCLLQYLIQTLTSLPFLHAT